MWAPLILRIAGLEVTGMIAEKHHDGVIGESRIGQRLTDGAHGLVHLGHAGEIVGKLAGPRPRKRAQILGNEGIGIALGVFGRRIEGVFVVLVVHFEIREGQQERRFGRAQELLRQAGHKIGAIDAGKVEGLAVVIVQVAFVGVRGVLQGVGALPQVQESAPIGGCHGTLFGLEAEVPFANVVGRIARGTQGAGQRGGVLLQRNGVLPDAVTRRIQPSENAGSRGSAYRLIAKRRPEQHAAARHRIEVGREVQGLRPMAPTQSQRN